jgi:hypothetical protein
VRASLVVVRASATATGGVVAAWGIATLADGVAFAAAAPFEPGAVICAKVGTLGGAT